MERRFAVAIFAPEARRSTRKPAFPCTAPAAYIWHHLTWQLQRTDTQVIYVSLTYDGVTHYVNRTYPARPNNVSEINVAFQMDGDSKQTAYSAWLDKVSLTYW